jgi:hypothetical protein
LWFVVYKKRAAIHTAEGKKKFCVFGEKRTKKGTAQGTFITLLPVEEHQY